MQSLICSSCGGNDFIKVGACYECLFCGTKIVPEYNKNTSEIIERYDFMREKCVDAGDINKALEYTDKILELDPHHFLANLNRFIYKIELDPDRNGVNQYAKYTTQMVIPMILPEELSIEERIKRTESIVNQCIIVADHFTPKAVNQIKTDRISLSLEPLVDIIIMLRDIYSACYDINIKAKPDNFAAIKETLSLLLIHSNKLHCDILLSFKNQPVHQKVANETTELIRKTNPSYTPPSFRSFKESYP